LLVSQLAWLFDLILFFAGLCTVGCQQKLRVLAQVVITLGLNGFKPGDAGAAMGLNPRIKDST
jgi:hypothetical protein